MGRLIQTYSDWTDPREILQNIGEYKQEPPETGDEGIESEEDSTESGAEPKDAKTKEATESEDIDSYTDKIIKTIPTEIVTAWLFIHELILAAEGNSEAAVVNWISGIILVSMISLTFSHLMIRTRSDRDMIPSSMFTETRYIRKMPKLRRRQILAGTIAFLIWVMYLGVPVSDPQIPIIDLSWYNQTVGTIFLAIYTVAIPILIPGTEQRGRLQLLKVAPAENHLIFGNTGGKSLDLSSWRVIVNDESVYEFPSRFELEPDKAVYLKRGSGEDTASELYWGNNTPELKDQGNGIIVRHPMGWRVLKEEF